MKPSAYFLIVVSLLSFGACKKSSTPPHVPQNYSLILRPDSTHGQDTWISKLDNHSTDGGVNTNITHELVLARWAFSQYNNDSATQRGYLRFDSLSKVPSTATVSSAILYLYGESASAVFPAGNSYYPGSPNPPNDGLIQRVIGGTWDQSTLTWNNAPAATSTGQVAFPASTSQFNYNITVDVTNLVTQMVDTPSKNYGFCLRLATEQIYRAMEFSASEASDSTKRPKLVVNYSY